MHSPSTGSRICPGLLLAHQLNVQGVSSPHLYNNTVSRCIAVWISNVARCRNGERPGRNAKIILTFDGQTKARQAARGVCPCLAARVTGQPEQDHGSKIQNCKLVGRCRCKKVVVTTL